MLVGLDSSSAGVWATRKFAAFVVEFKSLCENLSETIQNRIIVVTSTQTAVAA